MNSTSSYANSMSLIAEQPMQDVSSAADVTPFYVEAKVLAMCESVIALSASLPLNYNNDWFSKLLEPPQTVIVVADYGFQTSRIVTSPATPPVSANKQSSITMPAESLLSTTPAASNSSQPIANELWPWSNDFLSGAINGSNGAGDQTDLQPNQDMNNQPNGLYDFLNNNTFNPIYQYGGNGWIDTPLSSLSTNPAETISAMVYSPENYFNV